jgi:hypothetical protein
MKKARIVDISLRGLRQAFAIYLIRKGADSRIVQECLGRSIIRVTEKYSHLSNTHKRDAVEVLDSSRDIETKLEEMDVSGREVIVDQSLKNAEGRTRTLFDSLSHVLVDALLRTLPQSWAFAGSPSNPPKPK